MQPRFASAVVTRASFVQQVFHCTEDEWRRLPVQWRGYVLHQQHRGYNAKTMLDVIQRTGLSTEYDPQGVFDAYQGLVPA